MNSLVKTLAGGSGVLAVVLGCSLGGCSSSDGNGESAGGGGGSSGASGGSAGANGGSAGSSSAGTKNGDGGTTMGTAGTGGIGAGGADTAGAAGADATGAAGADTAGAAGAGATVGAVGKFCNGVTLDGNDVTLRLEIGTPPDVVTIEALSGTCVPVSGACKSLPLGTDVPLSLIYPSDGDAVLDTKVVTIGEGEEFIFYSEIVSESPAIGGASLTSDAPSCSDFQFSDL